MCLMRWAASMKGSSSAVATSRLAWRWLPKVCVPLNGLRHLASATRGRDIPIEDFYASYWVYQPWLRGGDPYYSPELSLESGVPRRRNELDASALDMAAEIVGRGSG